MARSDRPRLRISDIERLAAETGVDVSTELRTIRGRLAAMEAKVRAAGPSRAAVVTKVARG